MSEPRAGVRGAAIEHEHARQIASFPRRMGALLYEAVLLLAMALILGFALLPLVSPGSSAGRPLTVPPAIARTMLFCALVAGAAIYYRWCWSDGRRTLPQKTWRLRLVQDDKQMPTRNTALIRYAAAWIGPVAALLGYTMFHATRHASWAAALLLLNYAWALVDRERQFLHDRIAGTRVVIDS